MDDVIHFWTKNWLSSGRYTILLAERIRIIQGAIGGTLTDSRGPVGCLTDLCLPRSTARHHRDDARKPKNGYLVKSINHRHWLVDEYVFHRGGSEQLLR